MDGHYLNVCTSATEPKEDLRSGFWSAQEDALLKSYVSTHGEGHWDFLAQSAGLKRSGRSCRLRWLNYLSPNIKRGKITPQEHYTILQLHSCFGNRWATIAKHLPGRTDNQIKNYWRTRVQRLISNQLSCKDINNNKQYSLCSTQDHDLTMGWYDDSTTLFGGDSDDNIFNAQIDQVGLEESLISSLGQGNQGLGFQDAHVQAATTLECTWEEYLCSQH